MAYKINDAKVFCDKRVGNVEGGDRYSKNVPVVDVGFKEFIKIVEHAVIAIRHNADPENIADVLYEMTMYALNRFKAEEAYMRECKYAEYALHKDEHKDFMMTTVDYCSRAMRDDYSIKNDLVEYLLRWLAYHIEGSDMKFTNSVKSKEVSCRLNSPAKL